MIELLFATVITATSIEHYSRLEDLEFRLDFLDFQFRGRSMVFKNLDHIPSVTKEWYRLEQYNYSNL